MPTIEELLKHIVAVEKELDRFAEAEAQIKKLENQKKQLKDAIFKLAPSADFTTPPIDNYIVKALAYEVRTLDRERLKLEHPDIYHTYENVTHSLKLTIKPAVPPKEAS